MRRGFLGLVSIMAAARGFAVDNFVQAGDSAPDHRTFGEAWEMRRGTCDPCPPATGEPRSRGREEADPARGRLCHLHSMTPRVRARLEAFLLHVGEKESCLCSWGKRCSSLKATTSRRRASEPCCRYIAKNHVMAALNSFHERNPDFAMQVENKSFPPHSPFSLPHFWSSPQR